MCDCQEIYAAELQLEVERVTGYKVSDMPKLPHTYMGAPVYGHDEEPPSAADVRIFNKIFQAHRKARSVAVKNVSKRGIQMPTHTNWKCDTCGQQFEKPLIYSFGSAMPRRHNTQKGQQYVRKH